jgi:hypothetical protein
MVDIHTLISLLELIEYEKSRLNLYDVAISNRIQVTSTQSHQEIAACSPQGTELNCFC